VSEAGAAVGRVTALLTTPIKGLQVRPRESVVLGTHGVVDNRRFYLIDERDRMVNGKQLGALNSVVADYDDENGELRLTMPGGTVVTGTVATGDTLDTRFFSLELPAELVVGPWSEALSEYSGRKLRIVRAGVERSGVDRGVAGAVSLISTASVRQLEMVAGRDVDPRRFRMLIEVDGPAAHEEDSWIGRSLRVGEALVRWGGNVGRCLVTGLDPETGAADMETLELLRSYRAEVNTSEPLPFGIYGEVIEPGIVRLGDEVY
jgi:uncharacterized protein YcbX